MADINNRQGQTPVEGGNEPASGSCSVEQMLSGASLVELVELIFFAYRDFTADPDAILREYGFGRAHHRVLHFVNRYPGLRVAELLKILKITKQSLARVLRQLVEEGFIEQVPGPSDRRARLLFATGRGGELARRLIEPQLLRLEQALKQSGAENGAASENGAVNKAFLYYMINSMERDQVMGLFNRPPPQQAGSERAARGDEPVGERDEGADELEEKP